MSFQWRRWLAAAGDPFLASFTSRADPGKEYSFSQHRHLDLNSGIFLNGGPKDHINVRILQTMVSGIPLVEGPGTGMQDPYVLCGLLGPC